MTAGISCQGSAASVPASRPSTMRGMYSTRSNFGEIGVCVHQDGVRAHFPYSQ